MDVRYSRWTSAQIAALQENEGRTAREIAEALQSVRPGVSVGGVREACDKFGVAYAKAVGALFPAPNAWPAEHLDALRALAGHTSGEMVRAMQKLRPGVTRNAIIGQCKRHGIALSGQDHALVSERVMARAAAKAKRPPKVRAPRAPEKRVRLDRRGLPMHTDNPPAPNYGQPDAFAPLAGVTPVSLMDRGPNCCAWPVGEPERPGEQMYCGAPCGDEKRSYCAIHHRLSYSSARPWYEREKAAA